VEGTAGHPARSEHEADSRPSAAGATDGCSSAIGVKSRTHDQRRIVVVVNMSQFYSSEPECQVGEMVWVPRLRRLPQASLPWHRGLPPRWQRANLVPTLPPNHDDEVRDKGADQDLCLCSVSPDGPLMVLKGNGNSDPVDGEVAR
jgi:hypothetical protein